MKFRKTRGVLLTTVFVASFMVGCIRTDEKIETIDEKKVINVTVPNGTPSTSIAKLINEKVEIDSKYEIKYTIENTTDNLATVIMKGEPDIAIVPSNLAAQAYNKGIGYKLAGTTGWGSLYLISTEDEITFKDLEGKEVYNVGKGLTPDVVFKALLNSNGLGEDNVTLSYVGGATELAPSILGGKTKYAVVPEPTLTVIKSKNNNIKEIENLNDMWKETYDVKMGFPQASIIVKDDLINNHKEFVDKLLLEVDNAIKWVNDNNDKAAEYAVENGSTVDENIIAKSIKNSNLKYVSAKDSKDEYKKYYEILMEGNAKSIGEKMPDEQFFYEK